LHLCSRHQGKWSGDYSVREHHEEYIVALQAFNLLVHHFAETSAGKNVNNLFLVALETRNSHRNVACRLGSFHKAPPDAGFYHALLDEWVSAAVVVESVKIGDAIPFVPMKFFPKSVYQKPNPELYISESYSIFIESVANTADPARCWIVRETHGWYDDTTKTFLHKVETLHPIDPLHFMTFEEAQKAADRQVLLRAKSGFRFLFTMGNDKDWHQRFEVIIPSGELKPLP
jgi:hypothetical protein